MERYKPIIDDWEAFREECQKDAVPAVRRNPLKARKSFEQALKKDFPEAEKSDWNSDVYRLPRSKSPGKSMLHWRGEYYVQEESASLPVEVLDPRPGEKVLDMCAAPGGKTTQIASKMDNRGLVVSNDDSSRRLKSLHANIYRTGSAIVDVTNYDGRRIPGTEKFDRVLVDAPCSGEGNNARRSFEASSSHEREHLAELQYQLLEKAFQIVKEGGVVVYSTCTFAPEENEAVVSKALDEKDVKLEDIDTDVESRRGVENFSGLEFGEEMSKTVRIYPHHLNSGGIFVARFRK
ncbi:RsmB/NOP family class I SAM-dependent RNA methyltransferase [Candidatus Nanosalina sp. VS9-1]|uniref:RsmB/NOP family class I SAM-dependent RNA methyltransferase n=1 Tax=Candidatus Nanosalina sp. VS9-1 TaxID=3388566 RepID=UPI0039DF6276